MAIRVTTHADIMKSSEELMQTIAVPEKAIPIFWNHVAVIELSWAGYVLREFLHFLIRLTARF